ncbi:MAG: hypothetical protein DI603_18645 [Roseateles depolymerans]|uniref:Ice-binding protein C-terminal domain-containing protein n=1 Tax=Roseateles depolymerans TaxID=76731 RepID=A0A2W5FCF5_9BURK|nr:MAG: hypothetical protein DI603_18645 [Roseateles depolymerans]
MKLTMFKSAAAAVLLAAATSASHATTWVWSFAGEQGTMQTDGTGNAAGTYNVLDFTVTSSSVGGTLGSFSDGTYTANNLATFMPYSFDWNGSEITQWHQAGTNTFGWNIYQQTSQPDHFYFFGWADGNVNVAMSAAYYNMTTASAISVGALSISAVPEPASVALMLGGVGLLALRAARISRRKDVSLSR